MNTNSTITWPKPCGAKERINHLIEELTMTDTHERGSLDIDEPHPAAYEAKAWLAKHLSKDDGNNAYRLLESFSSCAIAGNRLAEVCAETLRRLLAAEPVSDRYVLGLAWTLRNMADAERKEGL